MLELVGITEVAKRKVKGYSLGMRQRLGLAGALLGDPHTVILDEPANGLDPEGIRWIRDFLVHFAQQGKTVLVSSHLLGEMALMAQDLVVIGRGRLDLQSLGRRLRRSPRHGVGPRAQPADRSARALIEALGGKARRLTEGGAAAERPTSTTCRSRMSARPAAAASSRSTS